MKVSAQTLIETIKQKSTSKGQESGSATQTEDENPHKRPVRMILYFDESHELIKKLTNDTGTEKRSAYQVLCKSLNSIIEEDVFVIHLSTNSNLGRYSPRQAQFWSLRGTSSGPLTPVELQAPFVELPFDVFSKVKENYMTLDKVWTIEHMVKFGRPLYVTLTCENASCL